MKFWLLLAAVVVFIIVVVGGSLGDVNLLALGLALFAGAFLAESNPRT